ncbi:tetratricopeptide repeat protein [Tolypothrix tenuis PCC 7101]|uniref:Tetratricopeptide repeat protein n=1 Tax=Tolypothrix tenuis PCC 7101 TaxID=231146 RepID=A0A1Z4NAP5_9CYAN|nr:tetratricopeptide repeat protein [Aulosira sp. FACHB-113]BAZ02770.1 tetratricopeptide repeat protein [Tolypothrix tenuis PCC 7101]BAZ78337.1 tetratricopeptide repeat protein [Aulosira laxa NIES-50]
MKKIIILITCLTLLPIPVIAKENQPQTCEIEPAQAESGEYSPQQLQTLASQTTVRVIGNSNGGSGTLLTKRGNTYLVVTNSHVITGVNDIKIQTTDNKTHTAKLIPNPNLENLDLALLEFQTNQNYCLRQIANFIPKKQTPVIAAGYSIEKREIVYRPGTVEQIPDRPLKEGYQIGYTSDIEQGMSGGAIINSRGELIGINGKSAYPLQNTGFIYADETKPTEAEIQQMRTVSWGIPVSTFLAQVDQKTLTAYSLPLPNVRDSLPQPQLTGWLGELERKAKQITVRIDSTSGANGSGIIIAKNGDTYTVLTVAHVVCERPDATQPCGDYKYQILTPDSKQYPVEKSTIKTEEGVDLGVVKFTANNQNYQVATLANYNPNNFDYIFTAGYPKLGNSSPWRLTMGTIFETEQGSLETRQSDFQSENDSRLRTSPSLTGGYELVYTSITYGGMSGGPILDSNGRVIGIHGRAEAEVAYDQKTGDCGINAECQTQIGFSLGIPVSTFLGLATRFDITSQKVENTKPLQLNTHQVKSIEETVLSNNISQTNTIASQGLERGNQLWRLNRLSEAVAAFDKVIEQKPSFVYLAYYGKGLALGWDGKYQEAMVAFEQAVKLKDDFIPAWLSLSVAYGKLNQPKIALLAIDKAIQKQPKNPILYNQKSLILGDMQEYKEAEAAINEAIKLSPRAVFYTNRGVLYYEQNQWELALTDYTKAIQINPQDALTYNNRGNLYSALNQWKLAFDDYAKAIQMNPQYADAYYNRGILYKNQEQWELALADYTQAIRINSQFAQAYNNRGVLYSELKQWELALADYTQAIRINNQHAEAYGNIGLVYAQIGNKQKAIENFQRAAQLFQAQGNTADYEKVMNILKQCKTISKSLCIYI